MYPSGYFPISVHTLRIVLAVIIVVVSFLANICSPISLASATQPATQHNILINNVVQTSERPRQFDLVLILDVSHSMQDPLQNRNGTPDNLFESVQALIHFLAYYQATILKPGDSIHVAVMYLSGYQPYVLSLGFDNDNWLDLSVFQTWSGSDIRRTLHQQVDLRTSLAVCYQEVPNCNPEEDEEVEDVTNYMDAINVAVKDIFAERPIDHQAITEHYRSVILVTDGIPCLAGWNSCYPYNPGPQGGAPEHLRDLQETINSYAKAGELQKEHIYSLVVNNIFIGDVSKTHEWANYWREVLESETNTLFLSDTDQIRPTLIDITGNMLAELNNASGRSDFEIYGISETPAQDILHTVEPLTARIKIITAYDPQLMTYPGQNGLSIWRDNPHGSEDMRLPDGIVPVSFETFDGPAHMKDGVQSGSTVQFQIWTISNPPPEQLIIRLEHPGNMYSVFGQESIHIASEYITTGITDHLGMPLNAGTVYHQYQMLPIGVKFTPTILPYQLVDYTPQIVTKLDGIQTREIDLQMLRDDLYADKLPLIDAGTYTFELRLKHNDGSVMVPPIETVGTPVELVVSPVTVSLNCLLGTGPYYPGDLIAFPLIISSPANNGPAIALDASLFPDVNWGDIQTDPPGGSIVTISPVGTPYTYTVNVSQLRLIPGQVGDSPYNLWVRPQFFESQIPMSQNCPFSVGQIELGDWNTRISNINNAVELNIELEFLTPFDHAWVRDNVQEITLIGEIWDSNEQIIICPPLNQMQPQLLSPSTSGVAVNMLGLTVSLNTCMPAISEYHTLKLYLQRAGGFDLFFEPIVIILD